MSLNTVSLFSSLFDVFTSLALSLCECERECACVCVYLLSLSLFSCAHLLCLSVLSLYHPLLAVLRRFFLRLGLERPRVTPFGMW